jgi:hypothetical protein
MTWKTFKKRYALAAEYNSLCPLKRALQEDATPRRFLGCRVRCNTAKMPNYTVLTRMEIRLVQDGLLEDDAINIMELMVKKYDKTGKGHIWNLYEDNITIEVLAAVWKEVEMEASTYCLRHPNSLEAEAFIAKRIDKVTNMLKGHPDKRHIDKFWTPKQKGPIMKKVCPLCLNPIEKCTCFSI